MEHFTEDTILLIFCCQSTVTVICGGILYAVCVRALCDAADGGENDAFCDDIRKKKEVCASPKKDTSLHKRQGTPA